MFVVTVRIEDDAELIAQVDINFKSRKVALDVRQQMIDAGHKAKATIVKEIE